jgi:hypothetical protein
VKQATIDLVERMGVANAMRILEANMAELLA